MAYRQNKSLRKAFAILECLNETTNGMTATTVAKLTGVPISTAHRLLSELVSLGWLRLDPVAKVYCIGFNLTLFGNKRLVIDRIVYRAKPVLRALSAQTCLTAYIGSLDGTQAIVEGRVLHQTSGKIVHNVGALLDGHAHSLGKALLAVRPTRETVAALEIAGFRHFTRNTIRSRDVLLSQLRDAVLNGYAVDDEEMNVGIRSIAVALVNPKGRAMCSIALEGPRNRLSEKSHEKLAAALKDAASKIMHGVA